MVQRAFWLTPETHAALERLAAGYESRDAAVNAAILALDSEIGD